MGEQAVATANRIIQETLYAVVASATKEGAPWNSPVFVVYDDQLAFYWASAVKSQHSQNIQENPRVFLVLFNSTAPFGKGEGVFIQARAAEVTDPDEIAQACRLRYQRAGAEQSPSDFTGILPRRMYRATPEHVWVNVDSSQKGYFVDGRQEVDLEALRAVLAPHV